MHQQLTDLNKRKKCFLLFYLNIKSEMVGKAEQNYIKVYYQLS